MKSEDTVMNTPTKRQFRIITREARADCSYWDIDGALELQARISFKVGKTAGVAESLKPTLKAIDASRKAGRKEVVEWAEQPCKEHYHGIQTTYLKRKYCEECWSAQLKDWGIK